MSGEGLSKAFGPDRVMAELPEALFIHSLRNYPAEDARHFGAVEGQERAGGAILPLTAG